VHLSRRRFLTLSAGLAVGGLAACRPDDPGISVGAPRPATVPTTRPSTTVAAVTTPDVTDERVLVVVQLNGGNDGLNTLVPLDGRYRDARPRLAVPEADLVALGGRPGYALHPALAPLATWWESGWVAALPAIGFADPNRSHFVSMDRWWRADDLANPAGWLGRWLDGLPADLPTLGATAFGSGAPLLVGSRRVPTVVASPSGFRFPRSLDPRLIAALASPPSSDPLVARAQASLAIAVEAVDDLADLADGDEQVDTAREGRATLTEGLSLAAELVNADLGTRVVVVSAGGFDTHANEAAVHDDLLADLAAGLAGFLDAVGAGGRADRVLVATTSEFGRRVAENGSGGTDHGAAGLSFLLGPSVVGGVHGPADLGHLLDGDVRPEVDPRTLYTACLDWLGGDADAILGRRYDEVTLVRA
jgi:uncharacterized protein (DUF1501 family)